MSTLWSLSTTVRNPERIRNFLEVLKLIEGQPFDKENQIKYQILLIQNKLYRPTDVSMDYKIYYNNPEMQMPYEIAEEIFYKQKYVDPSMRGRQSVNPLNKLGFSIARETEGNILITELGNKFIDGDYDIGYIFFKSLLKLQFPNPWSKDFSEGKGFDIIPLIATLHLINKVNNESKKQGLSRDEFSIFVPSLINYNKIDEYVEQILKYRNSKDKKEYLYKFAQNFYNNDSPTEKHISNFSEYGDNIMRYFRLTRYFRVLIDNFGKNWYINIEPLRKPEVSYILQKFTGQAFKFKSIHDYINYISDINLPKLPTEEIKNSKHIANSLARIIIENANKYKTKLTKEENTIVNKPLSKLPKKEIDTHINKLRQLNIRIKERHNRNTIFNNKDFIKNIIDSLKDRRFIKKTTPEQFEKLITESMKILDDEINIKPNYTIDDNGEPISHSPGNRADIECFYKQFKAVCEVTLNTSNYQWVRETQPVMRHLRDFELKYPNDKIYCIFIAPLIHTDTTYHFWHSIRYGYDGKVQNIIPLTTEQIAFILEAFIELLNLKKKFYHKYMSTLFDEIIRTANSLQGHTEWLTQISNIINNWKTNIIS